MRTEELSSCQICPYCAVVGLGSVLPHSPLGTKRRRSQFQSFQASAITLSSGLHSVFPDPKHVPSCHGTALSAVLSQRQTGRNSQDSWIESCRAVGTGWEGWWLADSTHPTLFPLPWGVTITKVTTSSVSRQRPHLVIHQDKCSPPALDCGLPLADAHSHTHICGNTQFLQPSANGCNRFS